MSNAVSKSASQILRNYPVPLSPGLPAISKDVELSRAMSASSRSSLFALSRSQVLYEDPWLIAVNKPFGVYCESVLGSVPSVLDTEDGNCLPELHLANRLDRDTTGVMLVTKSHKVAAKLVKAFTFHEVTKTYIALCAGSAPKWRKITLKSGHGRSKFGAWRVYAASDVGRSLPGGSLVRDMETTFEVLCINGEGEFPNSKNDDATVFVVEEAAARTAASERDELLVRARPKSGRTHQIRLHCQYLGISIKGDAKYDGVLEWNGVAYEGHHLHAESLSLRHPVTGNPLVITTPLPSWATEHLKKATL